MSGVRLGRGRDACTGLGKFAPLKRATWGNGSARCKSARTSASYTRPPVRPPRAPASPPHRLPTADCAPPAHLLPQYCTLLGKTRHRHRPRTGRRLQTLPPRTLPPRHRRFAPPARPGAASSHRLPAPSGTASSYRLPAPPGTTRALAPASHLQTAKRRDHQTVDAASTPKGE